MRAALSEDTGRMRPTGRQLPIPYIGCNEGVGRVAVSWPQLVEQRQTEGVTRKYVDTKIHDVVW